MTELFNRLGSLGVLLIAGALIVGGLTGAAVAHHYETLSTLPAASQQRGEQQGSATGEQGDKSDSTGGSNAQQGEQSDKEDTTPSKTHKGKTKPAPKKPKAAASPRPKPSGSPEADQVNS